jgi:hypothetical protein
MPGDIAQLNELFAGLTTADGPAALVAAVKAAGAPSLASAGVAEKLKASLEDAANPGAREGACAAVGALMSGEGHELAEPFLHPLLAPLLVAASDKVVPISGGAGWRVKRSCVDMHVC